MDATRDAATVHLTFQEYMYAVLPYRFIQVAAMPEIASVGIVDGVRGRDVNCTLCAPIPGNYNEF